MKIPAILLLFTPLALWGAGQDWPEYDGGPDRSHYSTLTQINAGNVRHLQKAWEYHTGDFGILECNPIVEGGVLYAITSKNTVFALDGATGRQLWKYAPPSAGKGHLVRGVTLWSDGDDRRLLFTEGEWLMALDPRTGQPIPSFGSDGRVSLKAGLGDRVAHKQVNSSTPGTLFEDLIIMPTWMAEDASAAPGFIQAFNVRTGKLAWVFYTIPRPGQPGYETWSKDAYKNIDVGSANNWPGMAIDRARGVIYAGTGSAAPDFWGGHRVGDDLYANCEIALDARTGKLLWHYQIVHHDLWDRDIPAPPNLLTIHRDGKTIEAVAQITKAGVVWVFDCLTGKPVFPIQDIPVRPSHVPGEKTAPTQPYPVLPAPFALQTITERDVNPWAANHDALVQEVRHASTGFFDPIELDHDTLVTPGFGGGGEWGGAATDPDGMLYVNASESIYLCRMVKRPTLEELAHLGRGNKLYSLYCSACHGSDRAGQPLSGFPSLLNVADHRKAEDVIKQITTGSGRMPGFPTLDASQKRAITDFLFGQEKVSDRPVADAAVDKAPEEYQPYQIDGYRRFLDQNGYPANRPPWGTLTAIDLNTGATRWRITLGEYPELAARGIPPTGTGNIGGPIVTASGLLFIAATEDSKMRAFDSGTGSLLWTGDLPAGGGATPSTYEAGGKQFVVIACGGGRGNPPVAGDSYVAFALP